MFYNCYIFKEYSAFIEITYDEIKFAVPDKWNNLNGIIELFKTNPYSIIKSEYNKFLYIAIKKDFYEICFSIFIKKQYPYSSSLEYNKINIINQISGYLYGDNAYYYKIKIPKTDYNYLTIQTFSQYWQKNYISTTYNEFILVKTGEIKHNYQNNKKDSNESMYIYYFYTKGTNFINLVEKKKYYLDYYDYKINKHNITQINGTNKIKLLVQSLKYHYNINILFYLVINWDNTGYNPYEVISGEKKISSIKTIVFEDFGQSEIIEYETEIDYDFEMNNISSFIVPIEKETNLIRTEYITGKYFDFSYYPKKTYIYYYIIGGSCLFVVIIVIIIVIIIIYKKKKKNTEGKQDFNVSYLLDDIN